MQAARLSETVGLRSIACGNPIDWVDRRTNVDGVSNPLNRVTASGERHYATICSCIRGVDPNWSR